LSLNGVAAASDAIDEQKNEIDGHNAGNGEASGED